MPATPATNLETVNISDTYYSLLHSGGVPIPATGQPLIRDGSGTPTALKLGANCNGATICGTLSATTLAGGSLNLDSKITPTQLNLLELVKALYPLNAVIYTTDSINPGTRSGWVGTTWTQIAQGRFIVGVGTGIDSRGESKPITPGNNAGEYNHILTEAEMPSHTHSLMVGTEQFYITNDKNDKNPTSLGRFRSDGPSGDKDGRYCSILPSAGGSSPHNNVPPGFGLYVWQRTA
jgi:hypothetical protein